MVMEYFVEYKKMSLESICQAVRKRSFPMAPPWVCNVRRCSLDSALQARRDRLYLNQLGITDSV